jgi:DNA-binding NtrC family response regulator
LVPAIQIRRPGIIGQFQRFSNLLRQVVFSSSSRNQRVLVISKDCYDVIGRLCCRLKLELIYCASLPLALSKLQAASFDVVIFDQDLPHQNWGASVGVLAQISPGSSILLLSTRRHPEVWNEVIRNGGHDMLEKPISEEGAESTIALARARAQVNRMRTSREGADRTH